MNTLHILLVDDELSILSMFRLLLVEAGYAVDVASNAPDALLMLETRMFDLLIADMRLSGPSGLNLMDAIKAVQPNCALMMISANPTREQIIEAFRAGADDFLIKPISREQLSQAVGRSILKHRTRREMPVYAENQLITCGALTIHPQKHIAVWHDEPLNLTPTEFCILLTLVQYRGHSVSAHLLVKRCRGYETSDLEARLLLKPHIANLRDKLEQNGRFPRILLNHRGLGLLIHTAS